MPHLEQEALYREFKLDEPWDSPHNINLLDRMPYLSESPQLGKPAGPNRTHFQLVVGRGAAFDDPFAIVRLQNGFPDGTGTILMVEAARPVPWTKPEDFSFHPDESLPPLGGSFLVDSDWFGSRRQEGFHMGSASAEMFFVRLPVDEGKLRWACCEMTAKAGLPTDGAVESHQAAARSEPDAPTRARQRSDKTPFRPCWRVGLPASIKRNPRSTLWSPP